MVVVHGRAPTGRICKHYVVYQCALLRMQYVYCTTRAKTWKISGMQQEKIEPNFSHLVQAECIIETKRIIRPVILCKRIFRATFPPNSELREVIGMENNKPMGALIWWAVTTSPTRSLLLAMIYLLSPTTTNRQNNTDAQVCVPRVRNSLIIRYKIVQIYLYFKDCSLYKPYYLKFKIQTGDTGL